MPTRIELIGGTPGVVFERRSQLRACRVDTDRHTGRGVPARLDAPDRHQPRIVVAGDSSSSANGSFRKGSFRLRPPGIRIAPFVDVARSALDFDWVTPTLAVGARFAPSDAARLAREHEIRHVVDLRVEECDDERVLERHGIELLHLPTEDVCAI